MQIRLRPHHAFALALALIGALLLATGAQAALLTTNVSSAKAKKRTCQSRLTSGAGIVRRNVRMTSSGLVRARTTPRGRRRGDWDLAIFSRRDGRLVAASAYRGSKELAEGVVARDELLTVQACRRSGRLRSVRLTVTNVALPTRKGGKIRMVRIETPTAASRAAVERLGLDLTEHARAGFREALLYSAADDKALQKARLAYRVTIADVAAADRRELTRSRASAAGPQDAGDGVPSGRTEYRRLADYSADMKALAEANPNFVRSITLPYRTLEGRPVEGIEITRDVNANDGKPVFLQLGVHHAREWPSGEHAMEWAYEMVNGLRSDDKRVTDLLGKARVIVVPIVNPDGFNLSREASFDIPIGPVGILAESLGAVEEFAYKRRNCRVQDGAAPGAGQCGDYANRFLGVDPNRNYGGFWGGPGASTQKDDDTYRGAAPFSEPETQNIKSLVSKNQVTTLITNHTYSDLVLRPPGIKSEGDPPDEPVYKALGDAMAKENGYSSEKSWELYDTTGTTEDWSYYATGGLGFTFEIGKAADGPTGFETYAGSGFHPSYPLGVITEYHGKYPTGGGNREAYFKALESTANAERHSVITGKAPKGSKLTLSKQFSSYTSPVIQENGSIAEPIGFPDTLKTTLDVGSSGAFEWHVNPSTRPFAKKSRVLGIPSDTPATSQKIESATIVPPVQTFPIEVKADGPKGAIGAAIDGADGDDWDLYLYKGDVPVPETQVAESAGSNADEKLTYLSPEPGHYTLEVRYFTATSGWTGSIDLYGEKNSVSLPAHAETWTLSCERGGSVVGTRQVSVERGQKVDVGNACGAGSPQGTPKPSRPGKFSVRVVSARNGRLKVAMRLPTSGRVRTTANSGRLVAARKSARYSAGRRVMTLKLSRKAMKRLKRTRKMALRVAVKYAPRGSKAQTKRVRTTMRMRRR